MAKKIFRILSTVLVAVLVVVALLLSILKIKNELYLGRADPVFVEYLKANSAVLPDDCSIDGNVAGLLGGEFLDNDIILLGESHGYAPVQRLDGEMIKFLNRTAGVKYYIAETDSTTAGLLNRFLSGDSPDKSILARVVDRVGRAIRSRRGRSCSINGWTFISITGPFRIR